MTGIHVFAGMEGVFVRPRIRHISVADVFDCLRLGWRDFDRRPSHYAFLCLIYPAAGAVMIGWSLGHDLLPMIYPLMSGFALIGPLLALGLYEISRRLERGEDAQWRDALGVLKNPAWLSLLAMSAYLLALLVGWLMVAQMLYLARFGDFPPATFTRFVEMVMASPDGWTLILWGNFAGLCFAVIALATSIIAFPLLIERDIGAVAAIDTCLRATFANPVPVALWGLVVAVSLAVGMASLLVGLVVILPVLGHATWHLYRKMVVPELSRVERTLA